MKHIRNEFPQIAGHSDYVYLDSASTTFKLKAAIDRVHQFYEKEVSNVHRGNYALSLKATHLYEKSRENMARFLSANSPDEIVFTKSTTEGLNLLAEVLAPKINPGDEILLTEMEHHSNFLPWKMLAQKKKARIRLLPVTETGDLDLSQLDLFLNSKTKIFSFTHQSNALGSVNAAEELVKKAAGKGVITIIDAAQSASIQNIDVKKLNCDFLVFSGHKLFSPSGVGVIYGKQKQWKGLEPYQTGGGMVTHSLENEWAEPPHCFEAGTPNIEGVLALSSAVDFLRNNISFKEAMEYEKNLLSEAEFVLKKIPKLKIIGPSSTRINTLSFVIKGMHSEDLALIMGQQNTYVRSGHHCCQPLMEKYRLSGGTVRVSFSLYNQEQDVLALEKSLLKAVDILK